MNTTSRENTSKSDDRIDKLADQISTLVDTFAKKVVTPASVKAVEESCVTCGGPHAYYNCPNIDSNQPSVCVATSTYNQVAPQNRASNYMAPPGFAPVQNNNQNREEYAQEILGFSNNSLGGNPTSTSEPIIFYSSPSLTPFEGSDFILEEIKAYLKDESISSEINHADFKAKSSIEEPPELELKDLPSHLEYAYLEGVDKLPVIIAKDLKVDEKEALLKVLKSHKRAIAWKITDIKGIDPRFCTHKILMEEDYKPVVQSKRRVNMKIHEMLERLAGNEFYCFLDGFSGYFKISINPPDQEKTTFTCTYGTFAYRKMPFGLCNAPGAFQRCVMAIFHDMIEKTMEVFMDDYLEKCHFMVKEGIVLDHKISKNGLEVDHAKVDVIAKLPHPTTVKGVKSFLGHAGFYRLFIQDFSKIARPMTHLFEKETSFVFFKECIDDFETLKKNLTEAPILVVPNWNLPFELMCDASDFAIGAVLGQ
nr:reverse transcriptase domain-containing protein [Tanacetum cinerariifolium]